MKNSTRIIVACTLMLIGALLGRTTKADYQAWRADAFNAVVDWNGNVTPFDAFRVTDGESCVLVLRDRNTGQHSSTNVACR